MMSQRSSRCAVLIDAHSLIHRAYHALPSNLRTKSGLATNAAYGFANMLIRLLEERDPDYVVVVFDAPGPTFRHERYSEYKANRPEMPDDLRPQIGMVKRLLKAFRIPVYAETGYEADDILGTLASNLAAEGLDVLLVSGDRDILQLVGPRVKALITRRGITDMDLYDEDLVKEKMGITPGQVVDYKGLVGDSSDNIPGVPGIGEKTAARLFAEYESLEAILDNVDRIKGRARKPLQQYANQARLSRELATINCAVPIEFDREQARRREPDLHALHRVLVELEFGSLLKRLSEQFPGLKDEAGKQQPLFGNEQKEGNLAGKIEGNRVVIASSDELEAIPAQLVEAETVIMHTFRGPVDPGAVEGDPVGIVLAVPGNCTWFLPGSVFSPSDRRLVARLLLGDPDRTVAGYNLKNEFMLAGDDLIYPACKLFDCLIAAYLINPEYGNSSLQELHLKFTGEYLPTWTEYTENCDQSKTREQHAADYCQQLAISIAALHQILSNRMHDLNLISLFKEIELPLIPILARMEKRGIRIDPGRFSGLSAEMDEQLQQLMSRIYELAGCEFNLNSPKQVGEVLFENIGLPVLKRTKTGPSTDAEVLAELAEEHEIARLMLDYRQVSKLKSTYVDALPGQAVGSPPRIHTCFNQTVTATGRLSSTNPNLQNIPVRTPEGKRIRRAFIPEDGWVIVTADYSQIELRILAHLSSDEHLIDAFRKGEDIHRRTAAEVFGCHPDEVSKAMRSNAKAINFGIVYGISDYGLARNTDLSRKAARSYIDAYFKKYPGVKEYIDKTIADAHRNGFVETMFGRRRYLPELNSRSWARRSFGERTAVNTPIQGSAADIIKLAMIKVDRFLIEAESPAKMMLQVHDELVFEVPRESALDLARDVRRIMESVVDLTVPLVVDVASGDNWGELHEIPEGDTGA